MDRIKRDASPIGRFSVMAKSRKPSFLGQDCLQQGNLYPSLTPGPLGIHDGGDPLGWSWLGDTPGPLGALDHGDPLVAHGLGGMLLAQRVVPFTSPDTSARPPSPGVELLKAQESADVVLLAAVAYGEASAGDVDEEMAAIASVVARQRTARGTTLQHLLGPGGTFAYAASDGNPRTALFRRAKPADRIKNAGMVSAIKAACNALSGGHDFSSGAYFWDGADIKSNYANHPKVKRGIRFTRPEHNIYKIRETSVDITTHWQTKDKSGKTIDGKVRGHYTHVYESTAALGGTVFWKYSADFLRATGNKEYD
jgi:hypothetical protein